MYFIPFRSSRIAYELNSAFARSSCNNVVKNPLFVIVIVLLQFKRVPTGICVAQSYESEKKSKKSESEHRKSVLATGMNSGVVLRLPMQVVVYSFLLFSVCAIVLSKYPVWLGNFGMSPIA